MTSDPIAMSTLRDAVALRLEHEDPDPTARIRAELPSYEHLPELEHRRMGSTSSCGSRRAPTCPRTPAPPPPSR